MAGGTRRTGIRSEDAGSRSPVGWIRTAWRRATRWVDRRLPKITGRDAARAVDDATSSVATYLSTDHDPPARPAPGDGSRAHDATARPGETGPATGSEADRRTDRDPALDPDHRSVSRDALDHSRADRAASDADPEAAPDGAPAGPGPTDGPGSIDDPAVFGHSGRIDDPAAFGHPGRIDDPAVFGHPGRIDDPAAFGAVDRRRRGHHAPRPDSLDTVPRRNRPLCRPADGTANDTLTAGLDRPDGVFRVEDRANPQAFVRSDVRVVLDHVR